MTTAAASATPPLSLPHAVEGTSASGFWALGHLDVYLVVSLETAVALRSLEWGLADIARHVMERRV